MIACKGARDDGVRRGIRAVLGALGAARPRPRRGLPSRACPPSDLNSLHGEGGVSAARVVHVFVIHALSSGSSLSSTAILTLNEFVRLLSLFLRLTRKRWRRAARLTSSAGSRQVFVVFQFDEKRQRNLACQITSTHLWLRLNRRPGVENESEYVLLFLRKSLELTTICHSMAELAPRPRFYDSVYDSFF